MKPRRQAGFTLLELLVGMAISAVALTGLLVASWSLQRSFEASNYRMSAQEDQLRLLDYLTRDLHAAVGVSVVNNSSLLTVTVPSSTDSSLDLNLGPLLTPLLAGATPITPTTPTTVSYYAVGGQVVREVNGAQTVIADTIADLTFTQANNYMTIDVTFTPQYSNSPTTASQPATRASSRVLLFNVAAVN